MKVLILFFGLFLATSTLSAQDTLIVEASGYEIFIPVKTSKYFSMGQPIEITRSFYLNNTRPDENWAWNPNPRLYWDQLVLEKEDTIPCSYCWGGSEKVRREYRRVIIKQII